MIISVILAATVVRRNRRRNASAKEETKNTADLDGITRPTEMEITRWEMIHRDDRIELENNWRRELGRDKSSTSGFEPKLKMDMWC